MTSGFRVLVFWTEIISVYDYVQLLQLLQTSRIYCYFIFLSLVASLYILNYINIISSWHFDPNLCSSNMLYKNPCIAMIEAAPFHLNPGSFSSSSSVMERTTISHKLSQQFILVDIGEWNDMSPLELLIGTADPGKQINFEPYYWKICVVS